MLSSRIASFGAGTRVKVRKAGPIPEWSTWDDDHQRTSNSVKRRLQGLFFKGDRRIEAAVVYIASESLRERLKAKKQVKVELRDPAGASVTVLAHADDLVAA
jgi:hypothetical protein